jgi:hypothetical protein
MIDQACVARSNNDIMNLNARRRSERHRGCPLEPSARTQRNLYVFNVVAGAVGCRERSPRQSRSSGTDQSITAITIVAISVAAGYVAGKWTRRRRRSPVTNDSDSVRERLGVIAPHNSTASLSYRAETQGYHPIIAKARVSIRHLLSVSPALLGPIIFWQRSRRMFVSTLSNCRGRAAPSARAVSDRMARFPPAEYQGNPINQTGFLRSIRLTSSTYDHRQIRKLWKLTS